MSDEARSNLKEIIGKKVVSVEQPEGYILITFEDGTGLQVSYDQLFDLEGMFFEPI